MLYAGSLGIMLIHATKRYGDLEQLMETGSSPWPRFNILGKRLDFLSDKMLAPLKASNEMVFSDIEATLKYRLHFNGMMAAHEYDDAMNTFLPWLISEYGTLPSVQHNLAALQKLYPHYFNGNCLLTGEMFTDTEIGLDAAAREEAMFLNNNEMSYILYSIGVSATGGVAGCVIGGAIAAAAGPEAIPVGCGVGTFVGGGAAGVGYYAYSQNKRIEEHQDEIMRARHAGISLVAIEESKRYRQMSNVAMGLEALFGGFYGKIGVTLAKRGVSAAGEALVRGLIPASLDLLSFFLYATIAKVASVESSSPTKSKMKSAENATTVIPTVDNNSKA
jgi:hypothetical protein